VLHGCIHVTVVPHARQPAMHKYLPTPSISAAAVLQALQAIHKPLKGESRLDSTTQLTTTNHTPAPECVSPFPCSCQCCVPPGAHTTRTVPHCLQLQQQLAASIPPASVNNNSTAWLTVCPRDTQHSTAQHFELQGALTLTDHRLGARFPTQTADKQNSHPKHSRPCPETCRHEACTTKQTTGTRQKPDIGLTS
jgi:hypothetical protein